MHYFPYARQDRICQQGESFAAMEFIKLINSMNFDMVVVADIHNELLLNKIDWVNHISSQDIIKYFFDETSFSLSDYVVLAPDAGAVTKVSQYDWSVDLISASKVRDTSTGEITGTELHLEGNVVTGRDILMIDDICDGGRTFIEIAKKLRELNVGRIELMVTHGIFSKGFEVFDGLIDKIWTTNSFYQCKSDNFVTVLDL